MLHISNKNNVFEKHAVQVSFEPEAADAITPLVGFVVYMADHLIIDGVCSEFECLKHVVKCKSATPSQTTQAVEKIRGSSASDAFKILPSFEGLAQGKAGHDFAMVESNEFDSLACLPWQTRFVSVFVRFKQRLLYNSIEQGFPWPCQLFLEMAMKVAQERAATHKYLETFGTIESEIVELEGACSSKSIYTDDNLKSFANTFNSMMDIKPQMQSNDVDKARCEKLFGRVSSIIDTVLQEFSTKELAVWLESAYAALVASSVLVRIPGFRISALQKLSSSHTGLCLVFEFMDQTSNLWELTESFKKKDASPQHACSQLSSWKDLCAKLYKIIPSVESKMVPLSCSLQSLAESYYRNRISAALHQLATLLARSVNAFINKTNNSWDERAVQNALNEADGASLLASGLSDADDARNFTKWVQGAKNFASFDFNRTKADHTQALASWAKIAEASDFELKDKQISSLDVHGHEPQLRTFLSALHGILFQDGSVLDDQFVRLGVAKMFVAKFSFFV